MVVRQDWRHESIVSVERMRRALGDFRKADTIVVNLAMAQEWLFVAEGPKKTLGTAPERTARAALYR